MNKCIKLAKMEVNIVYIIIKYAQIKLVDIIINNVLEKVIMIGLTTKLAHLKYIAKKLLKHPNKIRRRKI